MKISFVLICWSAASLAALAQDHGHLNIGAASTAQNSPLIFANRNLFETATQYVKTLTFATNGAYAGYYQGNITLTGLAATEAHAGPEPEAAALGAQLHVQLVAVEGPAGGMFAFWESGATRPTFNLPVGSTGTNTWQVSQNDGAPGSDPYGHVHGRRFTATQPGIYTVSFRAWDFSTNGTGGGPIHSPSELIRIYFQAGVNLKSVTPETNQFRITFSAPAGKTWVLEGAASPTTNEVWSAIGEPVVGDDYFHQVTETNALQEQRFFRTRGF